jgi:K+-transporting ATPase ATPase A chain
MDWSTYARAFVLFGLAGTLLLYGILRLQRWLPGADPRYLRTVMTPDLAMNTAISFATTTTWQAYGGESTLGPWAQMLGLGAQNVVAGAAGLAIGMAMIRGLSRERMDRLGNFWVDVVRASLWIVLPASLALALAYVAEGSPANFSPYVEAETLEGGTQVIPEGPVAPLLAVKNLGTNGGGYFNANGAHPFEGPTPLANLLSMLAIVVVPAALTHTFGRMVGRPRHGWVLFGVMIVLFAAGLAVTDAAEQTGNPRAVAAGGLESRPGPGQPGGNMEGKETRFGIGATVLAVVTTSNGATGSFNALNDSLTPLGVLVALFNMLLGEIAFGGLGTGICGIVVTALLGVFLTGLMIGRTPDYLGKVVGSVEVKLIMLYSLAAPVTLGVLTALALLVPAGRAALTTNQGPHGFSEVLFAYASCLANNGQSLAGLSANSPYYNITTALAMMVGRYCLAVPALALAGRFASQGRRSPGLSSLPTDSMLFGVVVVATALVVGGLSHLPALLVGPLIEHLRMVGAG